MKFGKGQIVQRSRLFQCSALNIHNYILLIVWRGSNHAIMFFFDGTVMVTSKWFEIDDDDMVW